MVPGGAVTGEWKNRGIRPGGWPTFTFFVKVGTARSALTAFP